MNPKTLSAFTEAQKERVRVLLASKVATMMGRKMEEGDWLEVYCLAKGIPIQSWSNLNIDVSYKGLGVEHKMLRRATEVHLLDLCGTTVMHPAATRSIRVPDGPANKVMRNVLDQYAANIEQHRVKVAATSPTGKADLRIGWLIWRTDLFEFLYFEQEWLPPDSSTYYAEWHESVGQGRKASKNLWVYEKKSNKKRFSITTSAGAKIQPYFDIPHPSSPHLYFFRAQGEPMDGNLVRIWVLPRTAKGLEKILGSLSIDKLSTAIFSAIGEIGSDVVVNSTSLEEPLPLVITKESYEALAGGFQGKSDEHLMELLLDRLGR
jgi:hypothetical protein